MSNTAHQRERTARRIVSGEFTIARPTKGSPQDAAVFIALWSDAHRACRARLEEMTRQNPATLRRRPHRSPYLGHVREVLDALYMVQVDVFDVGSPLSCQSAMDNAPLVDGVAACYSWCDSLLDNADGVSCPSFYARMEDLRSRIEVSLLEVIRSLLTEDPLPSGRRPTTGFARQLDKILWLVLCFEYPTQRIPNARYG